MAENNLQTHTGIALLGLLFLIMGLILLFAFVASLMNITIPEFLRFNSESYNYLLMGIVNIVAVFGLFYRVKGMWAVTTIFMVIIIFGCLANMFFSGNARFVVAGIYVIALIYLIAKPGREWYGTN